MKDNIFAYKEKIIIPVCLCNSRYYNKLHLTNGYTNYARLSRIGEEDRVQAIVSRLDMLYERINKYRYSSDFDYNYYPIKLERSENDFLLRREKNNINTSILKINRNFRFVLNYLNSYTPTITNKLTNELIDILEAIILNNQEDIITMGYNISAIMASIRANRGKAILLTNSLGRDGFDYESLYNSLD